MLHGGEFHRCLFSKLVAKKWAVTARKEAKTSLIHAKLINMCEFMTYNGAIVVRDCCIFVTYLIIVNDDI